MTQYCQYGAEPVDGAVTTFEWTAVIAAEVLGALVDDNRLSGVVNLWQDWQAIADVF